MSKHTISQLPLPANFELNPELHRYFDERIASPNLRFLGAHLPAACEELRRYKEDIETRVKAGEPLLHIAHLYRHKHLKFRTLCETVKIKVPTKKTNKKKSAPVAAPAVIEPMAALNATQWTCLMAELRKLIDPALAQQSKAITTMLNALVALTKDVDAHHAAGRKERKAMTAVLARIANCPAIAVPCPELVQFFVKPEQLSMSFQAQAPQACNG